MIRLELVEQRISKIKEFEKKFKYSKESKRDEILRRLRLKARLKQNKQTKKIKARHIEQPLYNYAVL